MTDSVEFREPTAEQKSIMQSFANICSQAINIILACEGSVELQHASARIQESMHWFQSYIVNGGRLKGGMVPAQEPPRIVMPNPSAMAN